MWLGLLFGFVSVCFVSLALVITYDGERMSSMWIRESCYFIEKHISFKLHFKTCFVQNSCHVLSADYFHINCIVLCLNCSPARPSCLTLLFWCLDAGAVAIAEERPEEAFEPPPAREWQPDDVL